jgi:transcriptional regulator with XRE-family HTH domain
VSNTRKQYRSDLAYSAISTRIVKHLHTQGMTLKQIGSLMGVTESFISRVRNGQCSLTLEHLAKLEDALGKSLPEILVHSTPLDSVPRKLRKMYKAFDDFLATLAASEE